MTDVKRLLTILKTSESAFIDHLFAFTASGCLSKEQFRDVIIAARASAYDEGVELSSEYWRDAAREIRLAGQKAG